MKVSRILAIALQIYAFALAFLLIWPALQVVMSSFTTDVVFPPTHWSLQSFRQVLWPGYWQAMGYSLKMAVFVSVLLLLVCLPAAYAMERRRFAGRALLSVIMFVPIIFPTVTYASAIRIYVFSFFNQWRGTFGLVSVVTAMFAIPLVMRSIQGSLASSDPVYEEAAQVMGASPLHAFFKVTIPIIAPGLLTAAMIGFTSTATAFTAPYILGTITPTVSIYIFRDVGKIGFPPWIAVEVLVMEFVAMGIVQLLYTVFRKQFRGIFT
jgi:ABC-type spermidine/putrescine transport system permease subunit II